MPWAVWISTEVLDFVVKLLSLGGGGVLPIMVDTGRLHPKGVPFSCFRHIQRVEISQVEVYKKVGKSVI